MISIVTPLFNRINVFGETIQSIIGQNNSKWEWIIIDDGSTDGSLELAKVAAREDKRIRVSQRDREPKGANTCRNIGISLAKYEWLFFLDSDDLISPTFVDTRLLYIQKYPNYDFLVFPEVLFKKDPTIDQSISNVLFKSESDIIRFFKNDQPFLTPGPIWRKEKLIKIGKFNEQLQSYQDWELNVRAILSGLCYRKIDLYPVDIFHRYTVDHSSITTNETGRRLASSIMGALDSFCELKKFYTMVEADTDLAFVVNTFYLKTAIKISALKNKKAAISLWKYVYDKGLVKYLPWLYWHIYLHILSPLRRTPFSESFLFLANRLFPKYNFPK